MSGVKCVIGAAGGARYDVPLLAPKPSHPEAFDDIPMINYVLREDNLLGMLANELKLDANTQQLVETLEDYTCLCVLLGCTACLLAILNGISVAIAADHGDTHVRSVWTMWAYIFLSIVICRLLSKPLLY
jgi:hypothetical protein